MRCDVHEQGRCHRRRPRRRRLSLLPAPAFAGMAIRVTELLETIIGVRQKSRDARATTTPIATTVIWSRGMTRPRAPETRSASAKLQRTARATTAANSIMGAKRTAAAMRIRPLAPLMACATTAVPSWMATVNEKSPQFATSTTGTAETTIMGAILTASAHQNRVASATIAAKWMRVIAIGRPRQPRRSTTTPTGASGRRLRRLRLRLLLRRRLRLHRSLLVRWPT
jgi:hypothetical protein